MNATGKTYRFDRRLVDWTSLTAFKEAGLEDTMPGLEVWVENISEGQYIWKSRIKKFSNWFSGLHKQRLQS